MEAGERPSSPIWRKGLHEIWGSERTLSTGGEVGNLCHGREERTTDWYV